MIIFFIKLKFYKKIELKIYELILYIINAIY